MPSFSDQHSAVDLYADHRMAEDGLLHVGLTPQARIGDSGHLFVVIVHGPAPYWAVYDAEEGDLTWLGRDEAAFDALYVLWLVIQGLGDHLLANADAVAAALPGVAPLWADWQAMLYESEHISALAAQVPGAASLAACWAVLFDDDGELVSDPAPDALRGVLAKHPDAAPALFALFSAGDVGPADLPHARALLRQDIRRFGSTFSDGLAPAARLVAEADDDVPAWIERLADDAVRPEDFLQAARDAVAAGAHAAAAQLAQAAIYAAELDEAVWYDEAHALLVTAAAASGAPDAARVVGDVPSR